MRKPPIPRGPISETIRPRVQGDYIGAYDA